MSNIEKNLVSSDSKDHHITTAFVDDGETLEVPFTSGEEADITVRSTSIPDFLEKPQLLVVNQWTSASAENTLLYSFSVTDKLFGSAVWTRKLENFNLFRGTACVRVQINANPFQQGRLLVHFLPCVKQLVNVSTPVDGLYNADITTKSTQAHVELDCRNTAVVLKMPFVGPAHFHDRFNEGFDWGTFYISVMSPLKIGALGDVAIDYSVFMWFEDFELAAPVFTQMMPMKGMKGKGKRNPTKFASSIEKEKAAGPGTPISDMLGLVSSASGSLSSIPYLGAFMGPVSWATNLASGVASVFGWSKPPTNFVPGIMVKQQQRYAANCDGSDSSYPLGLTSGNCLVMNDCCSIRGEDEMSFAFLKKIPALVATVNWSADNASGTSIYSTPIAPQLLYRPTTTIIGSTSAEYGTGAPFWYLSDQFALWRGTIKIRLSFVKTIFHSGRLCITFNPIAGLGLPPGFVDLDGSTAMLREIVDIRTSDEIELIFPFYSATNYLNTDVASGFLDITILGELRVPETANQSVQMLIYYSGGDDLEFQGPISSTNHGPYSTQASPLPTSLVIGGDPVKPMSTMHAEQCIGESFMSVKQLLNRFSQVNNSISVLAPTLGNGWALWPYSTNISRSLAGTGAIIDNAMGGDIYSLISPMYAFYRGSAKFRCRAGLVLNNVHVDPYTVKNNTNSLAVHVTPCPQGGTNWNTGNAWAGNLSLKNIPIGCAGGIDMNDTPTFSVPYIGRFHCSLVAPQVGTTVLSMNRLPTYSSGNIELSQPLNKMVIAMGPGSMQSVQKSMGDDFQFSYFMGTVPKLFTKEVLP